MSRHEQSISIEAAPAAVFALLADPHRLPEYIPVCTQVRADAGGVAPGARIGISLALAGRVSAIEATVVESIAPERVALTFQGPAGHGALGMTLAAEGDGTRLTQVLEHAPGSGLVRFLPPHVVARALSRGQDKYLELLKRRVEADGAAAPSAAS